jgi:anti-sigma B factor antagonist
VAVISPALGGTHEASGTITPGGAPDLILRTHSVAVPVSPPTYRAASTDAVTEGRGLPGSTESGTSETPGKQITVIEAHGDLDSTAVSRLRDQMRAAGSNRYLTVDLSGVPLLDTAALAVLVGAAKRARAAGGRLVFAGPGEMVTRILQVTGLNRVIPCYPGMDEAIASFGATQYATQLVTGQSGPAVTTAI